MDELLQQTMTWAASNGREFALNLVAALAIFVIGRWAAGLARRVLTKAMRRARVEETLVGFGANIAYALILAFVVIAAVGQLGVQTASFVAIIAAAGLAVGFALQGSLSNFAAGVLIMILRPFRVGDYVEAAGTGGTIEQIDIFLTRMITPDNKVIIVPNASITSGNITNYSAMDTRRCDLVIGVHYDSDLAKTKALLQEIVTSDERVLKDPEPVVVVGELADSAINFWVRPWCSTGDFWPLRWDLLERIKNRLDAEGIVIPFPQMDVHLYKEAPPSPASGL
jgi:small conductance mechanosensitive channel